MNNKKTALMCWFYHFVLLSLFIIIFDPIIATIFYTYTALQVLVVIAHMRGIPRPKEYLSLPIYVDAVLYLITFIMLYYLIPKHTRCSIVASTGWIVVCAYDLASRFDFVDKKC